MANRYARVKLNIKKMEEENYGPAYECSMCHIHVRSFVHRTICMECEEKQAAQAVVEEAPVVEEPSTEIAQATAPAKDTIATPTGEISRKVFDVDYMMLCDGFQYGMVKLQGTERSVRRVRDSNDTWELLPEIGTVEDISKEGLLEVCMSFARIIHGESPSDEECKEMIVKEWGILGQNK